MAHSCPSCGASSEFTSETSRVLRGTCSSCGGTFMILEGTAGSEAPAGPSGAAGAPEAEGRTATPPVGPTVTCNSCGENMALRATSPSSLEATCAGCGEIVRYVVARARRWEGEEGPSRGERPMRRGAPGPGGPSAARPCRECGGPLSFTTDEDGTVTGQCASCGNRFTLPARREGGRGPPGPRGGFRGGPRGRPGGFRAGPGGRSGGFGRARPWGRGGRDGPPGRDSEGERRAPRRYGTSEGGGENRRERRRKRFSDD